MTGKDSLCNKGLHSSLQGWQHPSSCLRAPGTCLCGAQAVGELHLPPLPGGFLSLLRFCQDLGQRRTTEVASSEGTEEREEESRRECEGWAETAECGG